MSDNVTVYINSRIMELKQEMKNPNITIELYKEYNERIRRLKKVKHRVENL